MKVQKIACISMQFPAPSETFNSINAKALTEMGLDVKVYSLLSEHKDHEKMVTERGLEGIEVNSCNPANYLFGLIIALSHPILLLRILGFISRHARGIHLVKSYILLPRVFYIWSEIKKDKPQILNLFWGHYPVMVGYLIKLTCPEIFFSMRLAAYDLTMEYGCSKAIAPYVDFIHTQAAVNIPRIMKMGFSSKPIPIIYDGLDLTISVGKGYKTPRNIITIGRLMKPKGIDLCIKAFSLVASKWSDANLVILGDGPELQNLKRLAEALNLSGRIKFKGHVSMFQVAEELAESSVLLFMSLNERLPNVVKEAMANRCLCVVSKTPGIEELVEDKIAGFILKHNTPEEAAEIIDKLFSAPEEYEEIRRTASAFALAHFDCRKEMAKLVALWEKTMNDMQVAE